MGLSFERSSRLHGEVNDRSYLTVSIDGEVFGEIRAHLEEIGTILPDADIQIAATAIGYDLELITGNLRHFSRIPDLKLNNILANSQNQ